MGWYINVDNGSVKDFPLFPPVPGSPWTGPSGGFATKADALAAEGKNPPSTGTGGGGQPASSSGWFVVASTTAPTGSPIVLAGLTVQHFAGSNYTLALTMVSTGLAWGPYTTQSAARAELTALRNGTAPNPRGLGTATPGTPTESALDKIGDFVGRLSEASTWLRVGEVLLGIVLLAIGVARITGASNAVSSIVKARIP